MVCPTRANPNASSACRIVQVSWKPLMNVPCEWVTRPSSTLPRRPEIAVADGEQGLGAAQVVGRVDRLGQPPRRRPGTALRSRGSSTGGRVRGAASQPAHAGHQLGEVLDDRRPRRCRAGAVAPAPRSTPTTRPKPPSAPAATPESASSTTTARSTGDAQQLRGVHSTVSPDGLPAQADCSGAPRRRRRPRTGRRGRPRPARRAHSSSSTRPPRRCRARSVVQQRDRAGVRLDALVGQAPARTPRSCGCRGRTPSSASGGSRGLAPGSSTPRDASSERTPS